MVQAGRFEGRSAVSTWMLAIARFKASRAQAASGRGVGRREPQARSRSGGRSGDRAGEEGQGCNTEGASRDFRRNTGRSSISYYHEKSVEEVAEIVGIPENTVKTRMFYAQAAGRAAQGGRN